MALDQQTLEGNWKTIKGKVHERWGWLTDDELQRARGNIEQLVGVIQQRTGETKQSIEKFLQELTENGSSAVQHAAGAVRDMAQHAAESIQGAAAEASKSVQAGMIQGQRMIKRRPIEAVATCFGVGLITGVVVSFMMRSR
jgi:uncharacterized protein YjbJ (UPF0337 family)